MSASDALSLGVLAALLSGPAAAQTPISADEFAAHVGTSTVTYDYSSGHRGTAQYSTDRTLLWAFEGEDCYTGQWFGRGDQICFAFSDGTLSACWHFYLDATGLHGTSTHLKSGGTTPLDIREIARTDQPLRCLGPEVGV